MKISIHTAPETENGSILIFILIAVALFAALSYAMLRDGSSGAAHRTMSDAQARLAATEIIAYADEIARAVQRLRIRGCGEQQIDFSGHNGVSKRADGTLYDYTNPHAPPDGSCGIFHLNGGKVAPRLLSSGYVDPAKLSSPSSQMHPQSPYLTFRRIAGVGTETGAQGTDLVLLLGRLETQICMTINDMLGIENPDAFPPADLDGVNCSGTFKGSYPGCSNPIGNDVPAVYGKTAFCLNYMGPAMPDADTQNMFYRVLIAR